VRGSYASVRLHHARPGGLKLGSGDIHGASRLRQFLLVGSQ